MRNILETEANPPVLNQYFQISFIFFTQSYLHPVNESYNIIIQINLLDLVLLLIFLIDLFSDWQANFGLVYRNTPSY